MCWECIMHRCQRTPSVSNLEMPKKGYIWYLGNNNARAGYRFNELLACIFSFSPKLLAFTCVCNTLSSLCICCSVFYHHILKLQLIDGCLIIFDPHQTQKPVKIKEAHQMGQWTWKCYTHTNMVFRIICCAFRSQIKEHATKAIICLQLDWKAGEKREKKSIHHNSQTFRSARGKHFKLCWMESCWHA